MRLGQLVVPLALLPTLAGCGGYQPGALSTPERGALRTVGCLDVAVEPAFDTEAEGPVASITFANRCDAAVRVDLGAIVATGRFHGRGPSPMQMFDPGGVIRPGLLDARRIGRELIEFHAPLRPRALPRELCLDLRGMDPGADLQRPVIACIDGAVAGPVIEVAEVAP